MAEVAEAHYLDGAGFPSSRLAGVAVARHGYGRPTRIIARIDAGHPVPDDASLAGAERALALAESAAAADLVLVLVSGGASANWVAPVPGVTLAEKQAINRALLKSGAGIADINAVRKHLSRIKGGRLARAAFPGRVATLAISDVPGDEPAVIGSGPTVPDPTTLADARAVVRRFNLAVPAEVTRALADAANESPKPGDPAFNHASFALVARPADAFRAAQTAVRESGYECVFLGADVEGEAREVAAAHAKVARDLQAQGRRAVDPVGRGVDGDHRRPRPRRPQPGICFGARPRVERGRGYRGDRRRYRWNRWWRGQPRRPGRVRSSMEPASSERPSLASIPPPFLPKTTRRGSSSAWVISSRRAPPIPM